MKKVGLVFIISILINSFTFAIPFYPLDERYSCLYVNVVGQESLPVNVKNGETLRMTFGLCNQKDLINLKVRVYLYVFGVTVEVPYSDPVYTNCNLPIPAMTNFEAYINLPITMGIYGGLNALLTVVFENEDDHSIIGGASFPIIFE